MTLVDENLINEIGQSLIDREETIAVAESVTSGLLQHTLSTARNASLFYQGGITAYNIGQKHKHLSVDPIHALRVDAVSAKIACAMARHASILFNSDWGIGITGYATLPDETFDELFAFYAIYKNDDKLIDEKIAIKPCPPFDAQSLYVKRIIEQLHGHVKI
jgi:nicotinamide-nucleotide amidase